MSNLKQISPELAKLSRKLRRGDKRTLAKRLRVYPGRISDAFDGFAHDLKFLDRLETETRKLIEEREAVKA